MAILHLAPGLGNRHPSLAQAYQWSLQEVVALGIFSSDDNQLTLPRSPDSSTKLQMKQQPITKRGEMPEMI